MTNCAECLHASLRTGSEVRYVIVEASDLVDGTVSIGGCCGQLLRTLVVLHHVLAESPTAETSLATLEARKRTACIVVTPPRISV